MQNPATPSKPLLVPTPTSRAAPPFIMVSEEELAPYSSTIVSLPPTIPELIQCWEQEHERCAQMTRFVERVRMEATKMAAAAPLITIATEALAASPKAASLSTATSTPPPPSNTAAAAVTSANASVNASRLTGSFVPRDVATDGSAATTTAATGAATATATAAVVSSGSVVRGTVLTGKVVSADRSPTNPLRAVVASVSDTSTPVKPPSSSSPTATTPVAPLVSPDELQVLRAKALAAEAAEQLLASTQEELKAAERHLVCEKEKLAKAEDALAQLRAEVTATEAGASTASQHDTPTPSALFAQLQVSYELSETVLNDTKLKYQSVLYALAQLNEKMATNTREKAFLEEKNTHLEGQLQRLLMSSVVTGSLTAPAVPAQRASNRNTVGESSTDGAKPSTSTATASVPVTAGASRLSASESYQKSALEKQIGELQSMTDKLTRDLHKQTARRAKAEETVRTLQKEVMDLKASALQCRRQINESELELERAVSRKEDDERLRQLERDGNRLRTALRERTEHFLHEKTEWERQKDSLDSRARVQEVATRQLLRRLFACQVREVVLRQCDYAASTRRNEAQSSLHASRMATPAKKAAPPSTAATGPRAHAPPQRPGESPTQTSPTTNACPSSAAEVPTAADMTTLVNRERQLEELKHTFERRVALVDAQRKAELQQLHALNKELRAALTASQEELNQKARLLNSLQQQQQPVAFSKFSNSSANLTPMAPGRSSSSILDRRDSAVAWVCRTDGDSGPGASMDELSDGIGGVYSSVHTPVVALPRQVTEIERRYDPEHMSTWEAVQVENEALLDRLTTMQEEKWKLTSYAEDLQRQINVLREELRRNASTLNQLLAAGVLTPAAVSRGSAEGSLRALQCLLQETLEEKFALEEQLRSLNAR